MTVDAKPRPTALLLSPHPDDEMLGCPAHLFALRDAGWRIVNVALSLGEAEEQRHRRLLELELACSRAGFELIADTALGAPSDPLADRRQGASAVALRRPMEHVLEIARGLDAQLLVSPSPHDDHPAHEWAGRLALAAARAGAAKRLWLWGLWADLAMPNSLCVFDVERLAEIEHALSAHAGELERNDYGRLLKARALAGATLLPERVFGYGSAGLGAEDLAEAVCEVTLSESGQLLLTAPATFDAEVFALGPDAPPIGIAYWLDGPSPRQEVLPVT